MRGTPWTVNGNTMHVTCTLFISMSVPQPLLVQGNTVKNFIWQSSNTGTHWIGIYIGAGTVNVGNVTGNIIGEATGTGSITIYNAGNYGNVNGIYSTSTSTVNISNNSIGSFTFLYSRSYIRFQRH